MEIMVITASVETRHRWISGYDPCCVTRIGSGGIEYLQTELQKKLTL